MSDVDLRAAIEAGVRAFYDAAGVHFDTLDPHDTSMARYVMSAAITAAGPVIEAQVRALEPAESIALTMALAQVRRGDAPTPNVATVCVQALARIARGVTS